MNTSNPFQIPVCLQRADMEQRRRERFKKTVVTALAATVALLVGLLIEGCVSEHAKTGSAEPMNKVAMATPAAVVVPQSETVVRPVSVHSSTPVPVQVQVAQQETIYVIKSGDTLSRIAKSHHTTINAIKAANGLANDRIVVGLKLKLPQA